MALVALAVVTVTSTGPALRSAGDVAVIEVDELTLKTATAEPKRTALALGEPVPEKPVPRYGHGRASGQGAGRGGDGGHGRGGHVGVLVGGVGGARPGEVRDGDVDRSGGAGRGCGRDRGGRVDDEAGGVQSRSRRRWRGEAGPAGDGHDVPPATGRPRGDGGDGRGGHVGELVSGAGGAGAAGRGHGDVDRSGRAAGRGGWR